MPTPFKDATNANWWVYAKPPDGGTEFAQVQQMEDFSPQTAEDFEFGRKYILRTSKWNKDKKVHRYKVYVLRVAETLDELKTSIESIRAVCPVLKPTESDFLSSESKVESQKKSSTRTAPAVIDGLKRKAADKDLQGFLSTMLEKNSQSNKSLPKCKKQKKDTFLSTSSQSEKDTVAVGTQTDHSDKKDHSAVEELITQKMNERFSQIDKTLADINKKLAEIQSAICKSEPKTTAVALATGFSPSTATSSVSVPYNCGILRDGNSVDLGSGLMCSVAAYSTLATTTDASYWCLALLQGVYGDDAVHYRYRVQAKNKEKYKLFSSNFCRVAKILYRSFLLRQGEEEPIPEKKVNDILSILSRRARDMNGRRNKGTSMPKINSNLQVEENCNQLQEIDLVPEDKGALGDTTESDEERDDENRESSTSGCMIVLCESK